MFHSRTVCDVDAERGAVLSVAALALIITVAFALPAAAQNATGAGLDSAAGQLAIWLASVLPPWLVTLLVGLPTLAANIVTAFAPSVIGKWWYDWPMRLLNLLAFNFARNRNADASPPAKPAGG